MKISFVTFTGILLLSLSTTAQPLITASLAASADPLNSSPLVIDNFSVYGIQSHYWLVNGQGEIPITVTAHNHLLISIYLYDQDDNKKIQTATLINNRTKEMKLLLENIAAGDYRLVITALATNHESSSKSFDVRLVNAVSEP
ncbi:TPA: hypothetical protein PXQ99_003544 [Yersinia enterocolitica]|nr:hypothetical protein [Yersinia enterocolitica]